MLGASQVGLILTSLQIFQTFQAEKTHVLRFLTFLCQHVRTPILLPGIVKCFFTYLDTIPRDPPQKTRMCTPCYSMVQHYLSVLLFFITRGLTLHAKIRAEDFIFRPWDPEKWNLHQMLHPIRMTHFFPQSKRFPSSPPPKSNDKKSSHAEMIPQDYSGSNNLEESEKSHSQAPNR